MVKFLSENELLSIYSEQLRLTTLESAICLNSQVYRRKAMARLSLSLILLLFCANLTFQAPLRGQGLPSVSALPHGAVPAAHRRRLRTKRQTGQTIESSDSSVDQTLLNATARVPNFMSELYNKLTSEKSSYTLPPVAKNENTIRSLPTVGNKSECCLLFARAENWAGLVLYSVGV